MHPHPRFLSWNDMEADCASIFGRIVMDGKIPNCIIGLSRGGVIPARIFADLLNIVSDFHSLDVKLYEGIGVRNDEPNIRTFYGDIRGKNILVVDDIWDSGKTMKAVLNMLKDEDVIAATLFWKESSKMGYPNYYSEIACDNEWIVFPWERHEFGRIVGEN